MNLSHWLDPPEIWVNLQFEAIVLLVQLESLNWTTGNPASPRPMATLLSQRWPTELGDDWGQVLRTRERDIKEPAAQGRLQAGSWLKWLQGELLPLSQRAMSYSVGEPSEPLRV